MALGTIHQRCPVERGGMWAKVDDFGRGGGGVGHHPDVQKKPFLAKKKPFWPEKKFLVFR